MIDLRSGGSEMLLELAERSEAEEVVPARREARDWLGAAGMMHSAFTSVEPLEDRIAPAAVFVSATVATFTDEDGDHATVKFTKPILTMANVGSILMTSAGAGGDRLDLINLTGLGTAAVGTGVSVTAKVAGNGDGLVNVGHISADVDLGVVTVHGDLHEIDAGDTTDTKTAGVKSLTVQSFGVASFLAGTASARSDIHGALGKLVVKNDFIGAQLFVGGNVNADGAIGSMTIGGTLAGTPEDTSGYIEARGNIGNVKIGGSIFGAGGKNSGQFGSTVGKIGSVTIGGSIRGGGLDNAGGIFAGQTIGAVKIAHDLKGGSGLGSGVIYSGGGTASVTIGGSVIGGTGGDTGVISSNGNIGPVKIGGDLRGGGTNNTTTDNGEIWAFDHSIASVTIGGDAVAAFGNFNGSILANENLGPVKIGGSIYSVGDALFEIRAQGTAAKPMAIASLTVTGGVKNALVLAGYGTNNAATSGNASMGAVKVGGDWIASSIAAGVENSAFPKFGDANDSLIGAPTLVAKIASITIGGAVSGTVGGTDHFGFSAQQIGSLKVGGVAIPLTSGAGNDNRALGLTGDFNVHELGQM